MERIRAFVALNLPVETVRRVVELQATLRPRAKEAGLRVGWVKAPNMHLTLKFLGEIPGESASAISDLLRARLAGRPALQLGVRGLGAFPRADKPRVLWVGLEQQDEALSRLAVDVDAWLSELGFAPEKRPFAPHVTLGRVRDGAADILAELEPPDLGTCLAREVTLYKSVLQRTGAEYTPLCRVTLVDPT